MINSRAVTLHRFSIPTRLAVPDRVRDSLIRFHPVGDAARTHIPAIRKTQFDCMLQYSIVGSTSQMMTYVAAALFVANQPSEPVWHGIVLLPYATFDR